MRNYKPITAVFMIFALLDFQSSAAWAQTGEQRLAFIVGNGNYHDAPLATPANDAGLISQTLTTAGFDVTGAADLDQESLRRAFHDFLNKVQAAGPHTVTFVYLAGYGLQYAGDNYYVPVDASLQRDTDIPVEAIRVTDFTRALAGLPSDGRIFVLDAAHANPFPVKGNPLAGGLALVDAEAGALEAFNAAPGTIAPVEPGPYGTYARALAEMLRYGGVPVDDVFARTRLRVNELTHGAVVPLGHIEIGASAGFACEQSRGDGDAGHAELCRAAIPPHPGFSKPRRSLCGCCRNRYAHCLSRVFGSLSIGSAGPAREGASRRAARSLDLAKNGSRQYAGGLLELYAPLSARPALF